MQTHSIDFERANSQYASVADTAVHDILGDLTIEAWVKNESFNTGAAASIIASKWTDTGSQGSWFLQIDDTGNVLRFVTTADGSTATQVTASFTFATGVWYHVAAAYDASAGQVFLYVNGMLVGSPTGLSTSLFNSNAPFMVGARNGGAASHIDGLVKDVRLFNDIRTQSEIVTDAYTQNVTDANLVGEWNFNNDYTDSSGNGNTLTPSGSPVFSTDIPWAGATQISGSALDTSLQAYFELDEASGTRLDSTANNNDLNDNNSVLAAEGILNNGAEFNGANHLSTIDDGSLTLSNTMSISAWVRIDADSESFPMVVTKGDINTSYLLGINSDTNGFLFRTKLSPDNGISGGAFTIGRLHHLVAVQDGSSMYLYVDGILVATGSVGGFDTNTNPLRIGSSNGANFFDGLIDEVGIWNKALTYGDVLELYQNGDGLEYTETTGELYSLTVNNTLVAGVNNDYPAYVDLSEMPAGFWSTVRDGGGDIRAWLDEDKTIPLAREVVTCATATDTGELHVKVPTMQDGTVIYVSVDGVHTEPAADSTYGSQAVWGAYDFVDHAENASDATILDSTANSYSSTANTLDAVAGQIGQAHDGDGTESASFGDILDIDRTDTVTLQGRFKTSTSADMAIFSKYGSSDPRGWQVVLRQDNATYTNELEFFLQNDTGTNGIQMYGSTQNLDDGAWHQFHITYDGSGSSSGVAIYIDGTRETETVVRSTLSNTTLNTHVVKLAARDAAGSNLNFTGSIDEVRKQSILRSANWITTEYNNQNDVASFWTIADARGVAYTQELTEAIAIGDAYVLQTGKAIEDTVTLIASEIFNTARSLTEAVTLVATSTEGLILTENITEGITLVDTYANLPNKVLTETLTLIDAITRTAERTITDAVTLVDTVNTAIVYIRDLVESLTLTEAMARTTTKLLNEATLVVSDSNVNLTATRTFSEAITLVATTGTEMSKGILEALTLVDTKTLVQTLGRLFTETFSVTDRLYGLLNGVGMAYVDQYADVAGEYIDQYTDTVGEYVDQYFNV